MCHKHGSPCQLHCSESGLADTQEEKLDPLGDGPILEHYSLPAVQNTPRINQSQQHSQQNVKFFLGDRIFMGITVLHVSGQEGGFRWLLCGGAGCRRGCRRCAPWPRGSRAALAAERGEPGPGRGSSAAALACRELRPPVRADCRALPYVKLPPAAAAPRACAVPASPRK